MKHFFEKDKKKRIFFHKYEFSRKLLKSIVYNQMLLPSVRVKASLKLASLPRKSSLTRVRKRCVLTGRGRFVLGQFNLSRMMFRKLGSLGVIPGLRKSSW